MERISLPWEQEAAGKEIESLALISEVPWASTSLTIRVLELLKKPLQLQLLIFRPQYNLGSFPVQGGVSGRGSSGSEEWIPHLNSLQSVCLYLWKSLTLSASPSCTRWWMTCLRVRGAVFRCAKMVSTTSWPEVEEEWGSEEGSWSSGCPPHALQTSRPHTFHILMGKVQFLKLGLLLWAPHRASATRRSKWGKEKGSM